MSEKFKRGINTLVMLFLLFGWAGAGQGRAADITAYLPAASEAAGWTLSGKPESYKGENLFKMINGGADVYHEYGFKEVVRAEYRDARGKSVKLEVYEMKDPAAAYGVYSFKIGREGKKPDIGQAAMLEDYYLNFWKGEFLVTLVGGDSDAETVKGLLALAKAVAARIKKTGERPGLVVKLANGPFALTDSKFVRSPLGVMASYVFDTKNIFSVREGVIGGVGDCRVFVFGYLDEGQSAEVFARAAARLESGKRFGDFARKGGRLSMVGRKKEHVLARRDGRYIIIVMGPDAKTVGLTSDGLSKKLNGK